MTILSQAETDFTKPEQHFMWALRGLSFGGSVAVIPRPILEDWSRHLVQTGAVHVSALWSLADENGKIDINDLPKQQIKYLPPSTGHDLDGSGKWVPVEYEEPSPLEGLTPQMKKALAEELKKEGY